MMISTLAPRATFAVAPAPTPTAFTGGDASYEAMCALAGMVVAAPTSTPCDEIFTQNDYSSQAGGSYLYGKFESWHCIDGVWTARWSYHTIQTEGIPGSGYGSWNDVEDVITRYLYAGHHCSPPMPECMLPGSRYFLVKNTVSGCPNYGELIWWKNPHTVIRRTSAIPADQLFDTHGSPIGLPNTCQEHKVVCSTNEFGECAGSPE